MKTARAYWGKLGIMVAAMILGLSLAASGANVSSTEVQEIPNIIAQQRGQPVVAVVFSSKSPLCQKFLPQLSKFVTENMGNSISFLGFATGPDMNGAAKFLSQSRISFPCYWVAPYRAGRLSAALKILGLKIGKKFNLPLVMVINPKGRTAGAWEGVHTMAPVVKALKAMGAM